MRRRAAFSLAASCLMAACAHQSPAAMPGMSWSLNHVEGEGDKLAFGQPNSDNVVMMMICEPRSGEVRLSLSAPAGAPPTIEIASRGRSGRFLGETAPSFGSGSLIEAVADASDPALTRFARTGQISVVEAGRRTALPVRFVEKPGIRAFFARCAASQT